MLAAVGYDDVFGIEHEDPMLPALEGVEKSVAFLRNVLVKLPRPARLMVHTSQPAVSQSSTSVAC